MDKLNQSVINHVLEIAPIVRAEVLYKFLVEGKSHRKIEKEKTELIINDGWTSWKIVQFFGDKGQFSDFTFQNILSQLKNIEINDFADYHINTVKESYNDENDGTDIFRNIKTRIGQLKLRNKILENYEHKCALCDISTTDLLITSHKKLGQHLLNKKELMRKMLFYFASCMMDFLKMDIYHLTKIFP